MIAAALLLIGFGLFHIIKDCMAYLQADREYQSIASQYITENTDEDDSQNSSAAADDDLDQQSDDIKIDWDALQQINPDVCCWLLYQDSGNDIDISMPIVQEKKDAPDRYLNTTFEGKSNPSGCVFVDADADLEKDSNVFLYGHNMRNGTMFGDLKRLYQKPDQVTNPAFCLYFPDGSVRRYQILSVCRTTSGSDLYYVPGSAEEFSSYLAKLRQNTVFPDLTRFDALTEESGEGDSEQGKEQKLVTLSTCDGSAGTKRRLLVTGIWKETEKE